MAQASKRDFSVEMGSIGPDDLGRRQSIKRASISLTGEARPRFNVDLAEGASNEEAVDDELMETMRMRPRALSHHLRSAQVPSRSWLTMKAKFWRYAEALGMVFHGWARPPAPKPSFIRQIPTDTIPIKLYFYVPHDYEMRKKTQPFRRYPVVVNFHGGGFTIGHATDDRYWARVILEKTPAIFVSVNYRLAPEHPFPQPVDDCVEALLYLQTNQEELHIDPGQIALSGFSAGGNLVFTVPFRLTYQYEKQESTEHLPLPKRKTGSNWVVEPEEDEETSPLEHPQNQNPGDQAEQQLGLLVPRTVVTDMANVKRFTPNSSTTDLAQVSTKESSTPIAVSRVNLLNLPGPRSRLIRTITNDSFRSKHTNPSLTHLPQCTEDEHATDHEHNHPDSPEPELQPRIRIVSILAWYPLLDWTSSRTEKKRGSRNPKKTLPAVFTDLFDFSYLPAPDLDGHHCSPYASPALAANHMIVDGLPQRIQMWLCEWDMLLAEGERFSERLKALGKDVKTEMIPNVPHGFDKDPNPFRDQKALDALYERAAGYLQEVFFAATRRATVGEGIGFGGIR